MKIALVHDYIKEYGGAERVLEALRELYPDAPVFTTVYLPEFLGPHKKRFKDWKVKTSVLQLLPFKQKLISPLRIVTPLVFKLFDFSKYDVIIVSATGAYFPNAIDKKRAIQVCYCHTPPRYLYGYKTAREWQKNIFFRVIGAIGNHVLRMVDYNSSKNVDYFIANSEEVAGRIKKFYRRDAVVIYPPVDINPKSETRNSKQYQNIKSETRKYFLAGGRLARPKHMDLIIRVCAELNVPLKVFGRWFAGYEKELKDIKILRYYDTKGKSKKAPDIPISQYPNIEFLGEVTDEEKMELMREAKAYIFASEDEDFGITPVEAMACGTPVIAYRSGGVKETVIDGKTGIFFDELTVESLMKAIKRFNDLNHLSREDCRSRGEEFSKERFKDEIKDFVSAKFKSQN